MSLFSRVSKEEQLAFLNDVIPQAMDAGITLTAEDIEELYDQQYFPQKAQEEWENRRFTRRFDLGGKMKKPIRWQDIELTAKDKSAGRSGLTDAQINSFIEEDVPYIYKYNIPLENIVSHKDIRTEYKKRHPDEKGVQYKGDLGNTDRDRIIQRLIDEGVYIADKRPNPPNYAYGGPLKGLVLYPELNSNEHIDRARPIDFVDRDLNVNEKVDPEDQWLPRFEHLSKDDLLAAVEEFTKLYETFVPHVYRVKDKDGKETGPYLIGYGTQYYTDDDGNRRKVGEHDPDITEERARELLKREYERLYDLAIQNWANFDDFDNAIRMQALEAGYNTGAYHWTSDKSPNWRREMDEYQLNHRWEDEGYDINEVLQHGNWSVHDNPSSWLGVRANLRNYPYNIRIDDLEKRWSPMTEADRIEYIKEIQGR